MRHEQFFYQQVERYKQATSQQERNALLYQIEISLQIFTPREVMQIAKRGGKLTEQHKQQVLGYIAVYFDLKLDEI